MPQPEADLPSSSDPFVARHSLWRRGLGAAALTGLTTLCLAAGGVIGDDPEPSGWALVGAAFFGLLALAALWELRITGPLIRVDAGGIWYRYWFQPPIPWSEVAGAAVRYASGHPSIAVEFHRPERHRPRNRLHRWYNRHRLAGHGDLSLVTQNTDRRFAELVEAVERFAPGKMAPPPPGSRLRAGPG